MSNQTIDIPTISQIFDSYEASINGSSNTSAHQARKTALQHFNRKGFPHRKVESWKYTNLDKVLKRGFKPTFKIDTPDVSREAFEAIRITHEHAVRLVFVDGNFAASLSDMHDEPGMTVSRLIEAPFVDDRLMEVEESLVHLNTVFAQDGAVIEVEANTTIETPVEIYHISTTPELQMIQTRNTIKLGKNSELHVTESYHNICVGKSFSNMVNVFDIAEDARLNFVKVEHPKHPETYVVDHTLAFQQANSKFDITTVTLSGEMVRNNLYIALQGEYAEARLNGLYLLGGNDHADNRSIVDHAVPNCYSNELYKGILDEHSTGVFNGKIIVREDAQKTNAYQNNRNILMSDDATINTKPQLEIYADDVKCSHGATSAQIEDSELFYLRARGIGKQKARALLMFAFAGETWDLIKSDAVKRYIRQEVSHVLGLEMDED